jgi:hypothetical protein
MANINIEYDNQDLTMETIADNGNALNQGQTDSIEFRLYFFNYSVDGNGNTVKTDALTNDNMISETCLLNIERPDGSSSNNIATTPIFDGTPKYFKFTISNWVTEHAGTLQVTSKRYNPVTDVTRTFGTANLNVNASASQSDDTIEDTQYQALLSYLGTGVNRQEVRASGTIDALDLVMFVGTVGSSGKLLVAKASQTGTPNIKDNPEYKFGVALTSATNNEDFFVQTVGILDNVDTSGFTEGSILVPSATVAGGLIEATDANAPQAPLNRTPICAVIYSHQNQGILYVRPTIFPKMSQVKDVYIDYGSIGQGQSLVWDTSEARFKAGFSGGVFYDDNLPAEADRFNNLTYFDED